MTENASRILKKLSKKSSRAFISCIRAEILICFECSFLHLDIQSKPKRKVFKMKNYLNDRFHKVFAAENSFGLILIFDLGFAACNDQQASAKRLLFAFTGSRLTASKCC